MEYKNNAIGKVIRIISDKRIIIDVGEEDLTIGDDVVVFSEGDEIKDLDGNSLGTFENVKDTLTVIETSTLYSVCAKVQIIDASGLGSISAILNKSKRVEVSLPVFSDEIQPLKTENDGVIRIGDLIRKR